MFPEGAPPVVGQEGALSNYAGGRRRWGPMAGRIMRKSLHGPDDTSTRLGKHPLMATELI
jgi:hypothetical protein